MIKVRILTLRIISVILCLFIIGGNGIVFAARPSEEDLESLNNGSAWHKYDYADSCGSNSITESSSTSSKPSLNLKQFVEKYADAAYNNSLSSGVPYDFTIGQAILESGYGKSELSAKYNNFFGIKAGKSWTGKTVDMRTREEVRGASVTITAAFRAYDSALDGFADHDKFLRVNKRYAAAFKYPNDSYNFLVEIKNAGYATDSGYVSSVWKVIQSVRVELASTGKYPPIEEVKYNITSPIDTTGTLSSINPACNASKDTGTLNLVKSANLPTTGIITPTAIVLHWWGGTGGIDSLIGTLQSRKLSVQIATTTDGKVHQLTATLDAKASHAKCANGWAIGNEIEGGAKLQNQGGEVVALDLAENQVQFNAVVDITAKLMATYNIPIDGDISPNGTSGYGVHSHKEVDKFCSGGGSGKSDVDDVYLKRVKDELRKRGLK